MAAIALPGDWTGQYKGSELNLSSFKLSFSDEFNTMDVVPNNGTGKWFAPVHAPYGAATFMSPAGATNPFSVSDGQLTITMKQVDGGWQSGTMQTVNSAGQGFAQEYGYFEMRAAFHGGAGAGRLSGCCRPIRLCHASRSTSLKRMAAIPMVITRRCT
ncbi:hypothetical protein AJ88_03210 [Mesorhizobium amorphae CCBAU 01583]|nr:hypothetical protein AJ88_03210 [Mesorhizobium amorphae CCBAU 01583]